MTDNDMTEPDGPPPPDFSTTAAEVTNAVISIMTTIGPELTILSSLLRIIATLDDYNASMLRRTADDLDTARLVAGPACMDAAMRIGRPHDDQTDEPN